MDTNEIGGAALVAGFLVVLLVLYRDPGSGVAAATQGVTTVVYFVLLPLAGLLAGVYAYADGPYSSLPLFLLGSYLGIFGLALTAGSVLRPNPIGLPLVIGLVLLGLALVALLAVILGSMSAVSIDLFRTPAD